MNRLTEKCWRNLDPWECCGQDNYCKRGCHDEGGCTNGCKVPKLYIKLAKYEDLEEQCVKDNQFGLHELCDKWKAFFKDIEELLDYRKKKEQGLLIPCKVGDTVYIRACCECVCMSEDYETGIKECPFENECEFEECENGNEKIFKTSITNIWNDGRGWYFLVRGLDIEIPVRDIGTSVFFTEEALAQKEGE